MNYSVTYSDGNETKEVKAKIRLEVCRFAKEGFTFAGWKDAKGNIYKAGNLYRINDEDNTLTAVWEEIKDYALLTDAQEAWELRDGGPADVALSAIGKAHAELKWTVWLNSATFGQVLDFSTQGSMFKSAHTSADLTGNFAVSAWIKAPVREKGIRTVAAGGSAWSIVLNDDGELTFVANGVEGISSSGADLIDGRWHHILVTRDGESLIYYIDGNAVKTVTISGSVGAAADIYLGSASDGTNGFDGSIAQVRIYGSAKKPSEVTATKLDESDNERKAPVFDCKHGITSDRSQGFGKKGGKITVDDILNCKDMGFKYMRMMIYVDNLIGEYGQLNEDYIDWARGFIGTILENGLNCMLSLGCGNREKWNGRYLGSRHGLEKLVIFFGELGEWIKDQGWTPEQLSILMFTEPVNLSNGEIVWYYMSDRVCAALRNVLPDHTIITSSDAFGTFEKIKEMSPVTDDNVIYSFTSYEPYCVGFNTFNNFCNDNFWGYVHDVPYPIEEGVDYTEAIEECIKDVPDDKREEALRVIGDYVKGKIDAWMPNAYPGTLYNADWLMLRAKSLNDWSERYGGRIHMFVAEFGACDYNANIYHKAGRPGSGIKESTRLRLIEDSRRAYDAYGITWSFWEYNEGFTIFDPAVRKPGWCVTREMFSSYVYKDMLDALGLDYNKDIIK